LSPRERENIRWSNTLFTIIYHWKNELKIWVGQFNPLPKLKNAIEQCSRKREREKSNGRTKRENPKRKRDDDPMKNEDQNLSPTPRER
jgi:hypothetical protein